MLIQKTYRPEGTKTVGVVVSLLDENGVYNTFSTSHWYATTNGKRDLTDIDGYVEVPISGYFQNGNNHNYRRLRGGAR